jgi:hypothetical protein
VVVQMRLAPGERLTVPLALSTGTYEIRSPQVPYRFDVQVSRVGRSRRTEARFLPRDPGVRRAALLAIGEQAITLENLLPHEIAARIERSVSRADALTAARALCMPSFRKLFPSEVLASGQLVSVGRVAFLVAAIAHHRARLAQLGDARAFEAQRTLLELCEETSREHGGAVIKTVSGMTVLAFEASATATRAALHVLEQLREERCAAITNEVSLTLHAGPAVTATFDGRLDYFGATIEAVLELASTALAGRVRLSSAVLDDPAAAAVLGDGAHSELLDAVAG